LQERDGGDALTKEYTSTTELYGDLLSAYASNGGATSYYEPDALGSTDALLDDAGSETDRYAYRAYGLASHTQGTSANDFDSVGKLGYFRDSEIDLYLLRARYYDPLAARFISEDPLGYQDDIHLYRYGRNNPVSLTDPSGKAILIDKAYRSRSDGVTWPGQILRDDIFSLTYPVPGWPQARYRDTEILAEDAPYKRSCGTTYVRLLPFGPVPA